MQILFISYFLIFITNSFKTYFFQIYKQIVYTIFIYSILFLYSNTGRLRKSKGPPLYPHRCLYQPSVWFFPYQCHHWTMNRNDPRVPDPKRNLAKLHIPSHSVCIEVWSGSKVKGWSPKVLITKRYMKIFGNKRIW